LFDELVVRFQNFGLFSADWVFLLQMDFVSEILGQDQVIFVLTQGILVFVEDVNVFFFVFLRDLEVASLLNLLSSSLLESSRGCLCILMR
jgi:hypothetical protein